MDLVRGSGPDASWIKLIGWFRLEPGDHWHGPMDMLDPALSRYLRAFAAALPHLSEKEVAYQYYFMEGVEVLLAPQGKAAINGVGAELGGPPELCRRSYPSDMASQLQVPGQLDPLVSGALLPLETAADKKTC